MPTIFLILLTGCATTEYVGETYAPTTQVDIFMSPADVSRSYTVMGKAETEATEYMSFEDMQVQLKTDAMAKGADGIIITEMKTVNVGSTSYSSGKNNSDPEYYLTQEGELKQRGSSGNSSFTAVSTSTQIRDHVLRADLIKYQD